ncbi:peptidase M23 [Vibrio breoganii]|uniref:Peptidase M23 n=1 Tax=Vibrio breoganii TaxID=553239 RepID=A0AAP8MWE0_9VIBR|nr:peptidoglycan DD-metalloendopeptidase family protein [Vibrio breoganii]NMO73366.1 peptidoglycan DD-metalloendopeptidase family protein [Vibrio breoganii]NMR69466.1 peptidoglycan DD-metalloendopeptidase family protein [Vibrio breoganii]PMG02782.1 peptidase M23 [Vibrio breoganii]PML87901.1 peptidase M23 [Vibrio breoganii]PMP09275.1 peptidase M23 [Vibrio breoganii]
MQIILVGNLVFKLNQLNQQSRSRLKKALLILPLIFGVSAVWSQSQGERKFVDLNIESIAMPAVASAENSSVIEARPTYSYTIKKGDNLSVIFAKLGVSYKSLLSIMEEDLNHLSLDTLRPGDKLTFWIDEASGSLDKMELEFNPADKVQFTRVDDDAYTFKDVSIEGEWRTAALVGNVHGSFSQSANKLGMNINEIREITDLLKDKMSFTRDLRAGDKFSVVHKVQTVDGKETGSREIEAINIFNQGRVISAYLHTDGQYYDENGESLQRAFMRYPVKSHRITSSFNPHRLHPVTGRVSPHNGTDFGVGVGTPVMAAGDGKVIMVRNHPYAGKYVVLEHGSTYKTRYLHLSRIQVKKGQQVKRGQQIGLSGATGRVTGPHLHYELLIRNRPVNAMTANIPMAESVPKAEMAKFAANRDALLQMMKEQEVLLASQNDPQNNKQQESL